MGLMELLLGKSTPHSRGDSLSPDERMRRAGFRRRIIEKEGACLFCNYDYLDEDGVRSCKKHRITFWEGFSAGEYICNYYDGSEFDCIIESLKDPD